MASVVIHPEPNAMSVESTKEPNPLLHSNYFAFVQINDTTLDSQWGTIKNRLEHTHTDKLDWQTKPD